MIVVYPYSNDTVCTGCNCVWEFLQRGYHAHEIPRYSRGNACSRTTVLLLTLQCELAGGYAVLLFEFLAKVGVIIESALIGYIRYRSPFEQ